MSANTGGPAFPQHGWSNDPEVLRRMKDQGGMTLLDWMAGQETIGEEELSAGICEHFAGPKPGGNWSTNPADWYEWEARWRAGVKYMRAYAMLTEKARREADHFPDATKMVALEAANRDLVNALEALRSANAALVERVKRLEIAGDTLATVTLRNGRSHDQWHEAKGQP